MVRKKIRIANRQIDLINNIAEKEGNSDSFAELVRKLMILGVRVSKIDNDTPKEEECTTYLAILPQDTINKISIYQHKNYIDSTSYAIRIILDRGIKMHEILNKKMEQTIEEYS